MSDNQRLNIKLIIEIMVLISMGTAVISSYTLQGAKIETNSKATKTLDGEFKTHCTETAQETKEFRKEFTAVKEGVIRTEGTINIMQHDINYMTKGIERLEQKMDDN